MSDPERFEDGTALFRRSLLCTPGETVFDIFLDREMWKKSEVLKNIADASASDGQIRLTGVIEKNTITDGDLPGVWNSQARDAVEQRRLPRAGGAEENCDSGGEGESTSRVKSRPALAKRLWS